MYNILITGNAGLLGSRLANYFIENNPDYTVVGIDNLAIWGGIKSNINPKVIFYQRDLQYDDIDDIFQKYHFDVVYHFACYAAEGLSPFMRRFNYSNNVGATMNIVNSCINYNVGRLVYTSSMSVYGHGKKDGSVFDENDPLAPIDPYGISKYACEMDIKVAGEQHGLDWCIIRPHNYFGPGQNIYDRYRNVLGIWMYNALTNVPCLIYGDGEQTRAFTYIDNALPSLVKAGFDKNVSKEVINLGGLKQYTINEAFEIFSEVTGYKNVEHKEPRHEVKFAVPTYQKSIDLLGYKEPIDFKTGLERMWEWAKNQPIHERVKWDEYEINKGIYSYWKQ